jgi:hypothetical protein
MRILLTKESYRERVRTMGMLLLTRRQTISAVAYSFPSSLLSRGSLVSMMKL